MRPVLVPAILAALALMAPGLSASEAATGAAVAVAPAPAAAPPPALTWAPMVRQVAPTVVTVLSSRTVRNQDVPDDPMLRRFFGLGEAPAGDRVQHGLGSGVIVRADGYILTNNHVVEDADELTVGFADGGEPIAAKVVGTDPKTDLAVLKIDPGSRHLAPIQLGDSDQVEVGEAAFAIGNPFGVGQTVTMGIVSAVGRTVDADQATYQDFLQTDASINPGNSGGALVDSNGRLIGINTAIISPTGTNLGIGFAIPVNLAHAVMDSIIAHGKVVRGFLGVVIQPLTPDLAKALKMPGADAPGAEAKGALVSDVTADGPAAKAGIKAEDVIVKMDQAAVDDPRHLRLMIAAHAPGAQVTLTVIRDGAEVVVPVTLADLPADAGKPGGKHAKAEAHKEELGVAIEDIDDHARKRYDLPDDLAGAVITQVKPESKAAEAGLKPGQVIIAIDRKPVASAQEASDAIDRNPGDLLLRVWNDGARLYIVVRR